MEEFDVLVIGGGPGGYSFAIAAAKKGMRTVVFEREKLGGTCLNVGCIPTKYLVDKANALEKIRALTDKGVFRDAGAFSYRRIQKGKEEVTARLVGGVQYLLKKEGVRTVFGEAKLKKGLIVECDGKQYHGKNVVIATGSRSVMVPVPGHEYAIDSTGALGLQKLPDSMTVVGGGVIGLELACVFASYGTDVTVVEMLPELFPGEQPEAARLVERGLKKLGIRVLTGTKVQRIESVPNGLQTICEQDGAQVALQAEQVLMAAGRGPNKPGIDEKELGLDCDKRGYICVDSAQRTSVEGVYAIGDVTGGIQLAHTAYAEAEAALAAICTGRVPENKPPVPSCVYTIPCFATVGLTTEKAAAAGYEPLLGNFDYAANGMALAEGSYGSVFVVMDRKSERTLGATIIGECAPEMIALAALAVDKGLTVEDWERMIVAHPSLTEMVREAALDAFGRSVHKG